MKSIYSQIDQKLTAGKIIPSVFNSTIDSNLYYTIFSMIRPLKMNIKNSFSDVLSEQLNNLKYGKN